MSTIVKQSFNINLTILRLFGLYPKKKTSRLYIIYGYFMLMCCLLPDPLLSSFYYLQNEELGIMDAGFNLFLIVAMLSFVPKMLPFLMNHEEIRACIYHLQSMNIKLNCKEQRIIDNCIWVCRRNSIFFLVCTITDNISWSSRSLFLSKREFPMEIWLPFDPTENVVLFYSIYYFVVMGPLYATLISVAVDPLIAGLTYHAAGQIKILKNELKMLGEFVEKLNSSTVFNVYKEVQECIRHHYNILSFVKEIENCFSWVVFSQFLGGSIIVCFCCLQIIQLEPQSTSFFLMILYCLSALTQIFFYCYYGTTLHEESNTLTVAAYLGRWYNFDIKSRKALIIFMQRANIPMTVSAGKVLDLSLDTFTQLIKKSYSLLAVLKKY